MSKLDDKIDEIEVTESENKKKQAKDQGVIIFKDKIEMPMIFFITSLVSFVLVYITLNQIKVNPFSSKVVTLIKWTSLLFFIIGVTSTFKDTYRGLDGAFVVFGLTINLVSLIFYISSISLLI